MTEPATGGLGGLGGYLSTPQAGNLLQAVGMSMMSSPRNNPLQNMGRFYGDLRDQQMKLDEQQRQREAIAAALKSYGFSDDEAMRLSADPNAARLAAEQKQRQDQIAADDKYAASAPTLGGLGGLGGGYPQATQPAADDVQAYPTVSDQSDTQIERTPLPAPTQTLIGVNGAAQLHPRQFRTDAAPPSDKFLEPVESIPQTGQPDGVGGINIAQFPIPQGVVKGKHPPGLPATAQHGTIMRANDGKNYQYIQLSGGPGVDGDWGWGEVNLDGPGASDQYAGNKTMDWVKKNHPDVAALVTPESGITPRDAFEIAQIRQQGRKKADDTQAELDRYYQFRDQYMDYMAKAPRTVSDTARQNAKIRLDSINNHIARLEKQQSRLAPPDSVRALELRAEAAGLEPGTPEYQNFMLNGGNGRGGADSFKVVGNQLVHIGADGEITNVTPATTAEVNGASIPIDNMPIVSMTPEGVVDKAAQQEFLAQLPPSIASQVQGIADGRIDINKVTSLRGGDRQELAKLVSLYDPTWDMSQTGARVATRRDYATGEMAKLAASTNLAIQHMAGMIGEADKLDNTSYPSLNAVKNMWSHGTGDPAVRAFETYRLGVADELGKAFKGVGALNKEEVEQWQNAISTSSSPEQLKAAVTSAMHMLAARTETYGQRYSNVMGSDAPKFLTPKSVKALQAMGIDPAEIDPRYAANDGGSRGAGGDGGRSRINNPAGAGQRQRAVNPQTGEAIEWDGTQWRSAQ